MQLNWPTLLVVSVTGIYGLTSLGYILVNKDWPRALMFAGYALANLGFLSIR